MISIAAYAINVNKRLKAGNVDIDGFQGLDLQDIIIKFLKRSKTSAANLLEDKVLFRTKSISVDGRTITGLLEKGDYGYSADGVDVKTQKKTYERKKTDAELIPFYYLIYVPKKSQTGILLLQRFGSIGLFSSFQAEFKADFLIQAKDYVINFEPLILKSMVEDMEKSKKARKIKFRKYDIPTDIANAFSGAINSDEAYIEYSIVAKRNKSLSNVMSKLTGGGNRVSIMSAVGFEADEMLMEVSLNGRKRTMNLGHPGLLRAYYDITDDVAIDGDTGHPTQKSLEVAFEALRNDLWKAIKGDGLVSKDE